MSALTAIKEVCYLCSGESYAEVRRCVSPKCPLFPYRLGHNPPRERTEAQMLASKANAENLKKIAERNRGFSTNDTE